MSLTKRLAEAKPKDGGLPCGITRVMSQMEQKDKNALEEVLHQEPRIVSNVQLQQILLDEGFDVSYASIGQHRRKQCRCFTGRNARLSASENV